MGFQAVHEVKEAKAKRQERAAFYTPLSLVAELVEWAAPMPSMLCLEPSAGDGRIVHALREAGVRVVHACEIDDTMRAKCESEGATILGADFLAVPPSAIYDRVLMNPPFIGATYRKHIEHAFRFLRPGGMLVAIAPSKAEFEVSQSEWTLPGCENVAFERVESERFKEEGTNIATIIVRIYAPDDHPAPLYDCSNYATGNAAVTVGSNCETYEAIRRDPERVREISLPYMRGFGLTGYGVNWQEVREYICGEDGDQ